MSLRAFEERLVLPEYTPKHFAPEDLPEGLGEYIYENFRNEIEVEFPSHKTDGDWRFTNQGYVGRVELTEGWELHLEPKTELSTVFGMLEYAYDFRSLRFMEGLYEAGSIDEFFDRIAKILAKSVIRLSNEGFYKEYVDRREQGTFVRGKIELEESSREPWNPELHTKHRELTANIEDNQILLWTLFRTLSGDLEEETRRVIRHAVRSLQDVAELEEYSASDCIGREYRRLNSEYEVLHALCHFLLDTSGPTRELGSHKMIPFLVSMADLYERFVAEWLGDHLSEEYSVTPQKHVTIDEDTGLAFDIDIVIYRHGDPVAVADTKYKVPSSPATADIAQVIAYATEIGVDRALLVYPEDLARAVDFEVGNVQVGTLTFGVYDELDVEGGHFLSEMYRFVDGS